MIAKQPTSFGMIWTDAYRTYTEYDGRAELSEHNGFRSTAYREHSEAAKLADMLAGGVLTVNASWSAYWTERATAHRAHMLRLL